MACVYLNECTKLCAYKYIHVQVYVKPIPVPIGYPIVLLFPALYSPSYWRAVGYPPLSTDLFYFHYLQFLKIKKIKNI